MKLIVAIIRDEACETVLQPLIQEGYRATRIASTGGFLRRGLTTLMIGVEDEKVEPAIQIIRKQSTLLNSTNLRNVSLFVMKVDRFLQI